MGEVFRILGPIFLLVALGAALQRGGFFQEGALAALNRLCYWVALPGLIFASLARGGPGAGDGLNIWEWPLLGLLSGVTLAVALLAWVGAGLLSLERGARGTFSQAAFRSNLAFVGLPVLLKVPHLDGTRVLLLLAPMMILYNLLAVGVLVLSRPTAPQTHETTTAAISRTLAREWLRNPILWASILGGVAYAKGWILPEPLGEAVALTGRMAVPLALLTIGAVLAGLPAPRGKATSAVIAAVAGKVLLSPALGWAACALFNIDGLERLVVLVSLACPSAIASYTMAGAMGGDEAMAARTIVASTLASGPILAVILALFA